MYIDSAVLNDVYDYLFENDESIGTNFCDEFPSSWIDNDNATIYLAKNDGVVLFKIKIERV
jgi:hypothetical protein